MKRAEDKGKKPQWHAKRWRVCRNIKQGMKNRTSGRASQRGRHLAESGWMRGGAVRHWMPKHRKDPEVWTLGVVRGKGQPGPKALEYGMLQVG